MHSESTINGGIRQLSKEDRRSSLVTLAVLALLLAGQFALVLWMFLR